MKKQIVFIEYFPLLPTLKIAKGLKATGKYETVLIAFNKFDRKFFETGFDKIITMEISQRPSFRNLLILTKKMLNNERRKFLSEIKALNPYIVQITGLGIYSFLSHLLINKKAPRVYYAYDVIAHYGVKNTGKKWWNIRNYNLTSLRAITKRLEKYYFKTSDGIIHKGPKNELAFLNYSINSPKFTLIPGCSEDWTHAPQKKNMDEIHMAVVGPPLDLFYYAHPFIDIIRKITSQKIHLHVYGKSPYYDGQYLQEEKANPYFHYHDKMNYADLNRTISKYHYGIILDFFNDLIDPLWPKTSVGHKMYNFLEAGLPIIISNDLNAMIDVVKKYKVGIGVDYKDLKKLKKILGKLNYKKLQQNVRLAQKELSIGRITKDLESFYEKVAERKVKKPSIQ